MLMCICQYHLLAADRSCLLLSVACSSAFERIVAHSRDPAEQLPCCLAMSGRPGARASQLLFRVDVGGTSGQRLLFCILYFSVKRGIVLASCGT